MRAGQEFLHTVQRDEGEAEYLREIQNLNPGLHTECTTYKEKYDEARIEANLR